MSFRVKVQISLREATPRVALVLINDKMKKIECFMNHIKTIFDIDSSIDLYVENSLLPPLESISLISKEDIILVKPHVNDSSRCCGNTKKKKKHGSCLEGESSFSEEIFIGSQSSEYFFNGAKKKKKNKKSRLEDESSLREDIIHCPQPSDDLLNDATKKKKKRKCYSEAVTVYSSPPPQKILNGNPEKDRLSSLETDEILQKDIPENRLTNGEILTTNIMSEIDSLILQKPKRKRKRKHKKQEINDGKTDFPSTNQDEPHWEMPTYRGKTVSNHVYFSNGEDMEVGAEEAPSKETSGCGGETSENHKLPGAQEDPKNLSSGNEDQVNQDITGAKETSDPETSGDHELPENLRTPSEKYPTKTFRTRIRKRKKRSDHIWPPLNETYIINSPDCGGDSSLLSQEFEKANASKIDHSKSAEDKTSECDPPNDGIQQNNCVRSSKTSQCLFLPPKFQTLPPQLLKLLPDQRISPAVKLKPTPQESKPVPQTNIPETQYEPCLGDTIVFKMLKIGENYCPEPSEEITGKVCAIDEDGIIELEILEGIKEFDLPCGKFSLVETEEGDDHIDEAKSTSNVKLKASELINPRLLTVDHS